MTGPIPTPGTRFRIRFLPAVPGTNAAASAAAARDAANDAQNSANQAAALIGTTVLKAGDTMTGPLILSGDPTVANQAATKNYVDTSSVNPAGTHPVNSLARWVDANHIDGVPIGSTMNMTGGVLNTNAGGGNLNAAGTPSVGNLAQWTSATTLQGIPISTITGTLAPLNSPVLTGTPQAPTAPANDASAQIATTAFVTNAVTTQGFTTGDAKLTLKTAADAGWVMMNDGTIGDASSGANRANADCQALYMLLWTNIADAWAPVGGGRGATAAADWTAHKTLKLPRQLGRSLLIAGTGATLSTRQIGSYFGAETKSLSWVENGPHYHNVHTGGHSHSINTGAHGHYIHTNPHAHNINQLVAGVPNYIVASDGSTGVSNTGGPYYLGTGILSEITETTGDVGGYADAVGDLGGGTNGVGDLGGSTDQQGSGTPFDLMNPSACWNIMIKL